LGADLGRFGAAQTVLDQEGVTTMIRGVREFAFLQRTKLHYCTAVDCRGTGGAAEWSAMFKLVKKWTAIPAVKYSIIAVASLLWLVGFADQLPDAMQTAKYVGISLLMVAVAAIA
jgi:hypothetical protein